MESKLGLDFQKVEYARGLAKGIAEDVQSFVEQYTTVAVERTLCRLMGIDGIDAPCLLACSAIVRGCLKKSSPFS